MSTETLRDASRIVRLCCRVGLHRWRKLRLGNGPMPAYPVVLLAVLSQRECVCCGLVRMEGRWRGLCMVTTGRIPYCGDDSVSAASPLAEAGENWRTRRRDWGLV